MPLAIPTRSIQMWHMLVNRYIAAHTLNGKTITTERAHNDLIKLYEEFHSILGPYASDHNVLQKLYSIVVEYENEGFRGFSALDLSSN